ncbi:hypothetical protein GCM10027073_20440 [Streptomyces chlorus]|uniref:DUF3558 family protein n=1 Tax=Streptomyces chlorus TaxID=887452 RepID=A0ABW1DZT8_9ACTN
MTHTRTRTRSRSRDRGRNRPLSLAGVALGALLMLTLQGCQDADSDATNKPSPTASATSAPAEPNTEEPSQAPSPTSPTSVGDPCALVTQQEAERLAGTPVKPGNVVDETCTYVAPESGPTAQVEIFAGESGQNYYDAERQLGHELKPLDGIGDEAYLEDGSVFLRVAEEWVSIRLVRGNPAAENDQPLTDLARTVATRL